jgi:hypothetical protein
LFKDTDLPGDNHSGFDDDTSILENYDEDLDDILNKENSEAVKRVKDDYCEPSPNTYASEVSEFDNIANVKEL